MSDEKQQYRQDGYTPKDINVQKGYTPLGHQPANSSQSSNTGKENPPQGSSGVPDKKK